jgi:hypothetical protein
MTRPLEIGFQSRVMPDPPLQIEQNKNKKPSMAPLCPMSLLLRAAAALRRGVPAATKQRRHRRGRREHVPPGPAMPPLCVPPSGAATTAAALCAVVEPAVSGRRSTRLHCGHRRSTRRRRGPRPWVATPHAAAAGTAAARAFVEARGHGPLPCTPPLQVRAAVKP